MPRIANRSLCASLCLDRPVGSGSRNSGQSADDPLAQGFKQPLDFSQAKNLVALDQEQCHQEGITKDLE